MKRRMKKEKFYSKALLTLATSAIIITSIPTIQYAATSDSDFSIQHSFYKLLTTVGATNPHQDTFTAYMYNAKKLDSSIANYRTYYGIGETLRIKVTFTSSISTVESPSLVMKFGSGSERNVTNCILGSNDTESSGDDYIIFEYTLQEGDTGGLQLLSLSGIAKNSDGYAIEMALPSNANVYSNKIIADTTAPTSSYAGVSAKLTTNEGIYILENNKIRNLKQSDVKFIVDNTIQSGDISTVSIVSNKEIQILSSSFSSICIPNAVDIAGNPIAIHYNYMGGTSDKVLPALTVTTDVSTDNIVDNVSYCKEGTQLKIVVWQSDDLYANLRVKFGSGDYKSATKQGSADGYITWIYDIQAGDNGVLTINVDGNCRCGAEFDDNELQYSNIVADTTAPTLTWYGMAGGTGWISGYFPVDESVTNAKKASGKYNADKELLPNTDQDAILYISSGMPVAYVSVEDENLAETLDMNYQIDASDDFKSILSESNFGYSKIGEKKYSCWYMNIQAYKQNIMSKYGYSVTVTDLAGNSQTVSTWDSGLKMVIDWEKPNVTISSDVETTKDDILTFTVKAEDVDYEDLAGSGISETIDISKVIVENGTAISSTLNDDGTITLNVMAGVDGYVSVHLPDGAISDNVGNSNNPSNVCKTLVDRTAPVIHDITGVPTEYTTSATLSVIASDAESGLADAPYSFDGGANWTDSNTKEFTRGGKYEICVKDKVGNVSKTIVDLSRVGSAQTYDTTPPVITEILGVPTDWGNESTTVTVVASDDESGLAEEPYSFDGGDTWSQFNYKKFTQTTTIKVCVKDKVGNIVSTIVHIRIGDAVTFDTTSSGTCIKDVKDVGGETYIIVEPQTTAETLLKYVGSPVYAINVKTEDQKTEIEKSSVVSTNNKIVLEDTEKSFIVVVKGDVCADGKINLSDILKVNKARLGKISLTKAESLAADVSEDGKINLSDIIKLNKYRLGKINNL